MMLSFHLECDIARPIEEVFAFLRDIERHAGQPGSVVPIYDKLTSGPPHIGTQYREVIALGPALRGEILSKLSVFDPPQRLGYRFHGMGMKGDLLYEFTPTAVGTHLQQHQTLQPLGLLRLLSPLIQLLFGWAIKRRLRAIKRLIEAGPKGV